MSNEYNQLITSDLAEISKDLLVVLQEKECVNMRGIGALLQLASVLMATAMPTERDHEIATRTIATLDGNHLALVSVIAHCAKAMAMSHYGMLKGTDGQV